MLKKLLFLTVLVTSLGVYGQRNCGTMEVLQQMQKEDPLLEQRMNDIEEFTQNYIQSNAEAVSGVVTIPVVVHVVYNKRKSVENISMAQINSQIQVLNADFRRNNTDANNMWSQADDLEIEFCLASVDPSGNATTGVTRKSTKKNSFGTNNSVKYNSQGGQNAWPTTDYLNIWVCNIGGGILGYAQFPGGNTATDGVVIDYRYMGTTGTATYPFDLGRTATHEVGHWLNLRHIWGDAPCGTDDFVNDTPESDAPNFGCATGHTSCGSLDMIENYMDYSDDACMNMFTAGQKTRSRSLFDAGGFRASLLSSTGCGGTPPVATCSDGIQNQGETGVDCGGPCSTPCPPAGACADPTGLSSTSKKGGRSALLAWNSVSGASSYGLGLRLAGSSSWSQVTTTSNTSVNANGLTKGASYEWYVQANCGAGSSSNQVQATFTAGQNARTAEMADIQVYPNPANNFIDIDLFSAEDGVVNVSMVDIAGRLVKTEEFNLVSGNNSLELDLSNVSSGLYILTLKLNSEEVKIKITKN